MFNTVIWATDGSEAAARALPFAKTLASEPEAKLVVLHVRELLVGRAGGYPVRADEDDLELGLQGLVSGCAMRAASVSSRASVRDVGSPGNEHRAAALAAAHAFDIDAVKQRLVAANGGYEIIHESEGLELGVYVLVAPEPDRQQPHDDDEVYIVLEGEGTLDVAGTPVALRQGHAVFVPAGAEHRFSGYEQLSVFVIFERRR